MTYGKTVTIASDIQMINPSKDDLKDQSCLQYAYKIQVAHENGTEFPSIKDLKEKFKEIDNHD